MPAISLATAQAQLEAYLAASLAVSQNQSYSIAGRSLSRANLSEIQTAISFWENKVNALTRAAAGRGRTRYVVPQ